MKPISVVIPTANRPEYLRAALTTIAQQTAANEIEEILVSENLGSRASEDVCKEFSLPITYIFREPQITPVEHLYQLYQEARAPFVAMICDDDWWAPGHLHTALHALRLNEDASALFSGCVFIASETTPQTFHLWRPAALSVALHQPDFLQRLSVTHAQVLTAAWINTPFHFSTLVARRDALRKASVLMREAHFYYADRILAPALSQSGPIAYEPLADTFIRWHPGNFGKDGRESGLDEAFREGSAKILALAKEAGFDPIAEWHALLPEIPADMEDEIGVDFRNTLTDDGLREHGFERFIQKPVPPVSILRKTARRARQQVSRFLQTLEKP